MKTSQKQLPKSQMQIDVQLDTADLEQYRVEAVAVLAKEMNIEGFRPGHVSVAVAEKHLQETTIFAEIARVAIAHTYKKVLEEQDLDVIGEPEVQVLKFALGNPLEFKIIVAILPDVELPEYAKIAKESEKRAVKVEDKEVEDALQWLQESRKTSAESPKGIETDSPKSESFGEQSGEAGLGGKDAAFDDNFARSVGSFNSLAELKESITEGLQHEKELKEKDRVRQEILEHIAEKSTVEIPDLLIEREKGVLLQNVKQGVSQMMGISFEEYLQQSKKTEQELLASFQQEAEKRVKRFLVLREIARKEEINPTQKEIEQEANNILSHYKEATKAQKEIDPERLKEYTEGVIRHEKTLQFLEELTLPSQA